ncbi:MAG TPA: hypothetical protein VIP11_16415 [Gemmatimonadaceae bacterium]
MISGKRLALYVALGLVAACGGDSSSPTPPDDKPMTGCTSLLDRSSSALGVGTTGAATMQTLGGCAVTSRYTGEIAVRGSLAYTATWGQRALPGNVFYIWDVSGNTPGLVDSVVVSGAIAELGDIQISDDGKYLVVATEFAPGHLIVYDLVDPRHPREVSRFSNELTAPGVHTAKLGRVDGKLYAFLAIYPSVAPRVVIVDLSDPAAPKEVYTKQIGRPWLHDTFFRDGLLFVAIWSDGVEIWDLGGAGNGSPSNPRVISRVQTIESVHNVWWYHDATGAKRYLFVGREGGGSIGSTSSGDISVVDISDMTKPREVAVFRVEGAGTHNFSVDEANGILYAAYYNSGVRAIDVRGDVGTCAAIYQLVTFGLQCCSLGFMGRELGVGLLDRGKPVYVWGVQYANGRVFASDMLNGIWALRAVSR